MSGMHFIRMTLRVERWISLSQKSTHEFSSLNDNGWEVRERL